MNAFLVKPFCLAAKIIYLESTDEKNNIRFVEMAPFLFVMSDSTFKKWSEVHEMCQEGELIAYNQTCQRLAIKWKDRSSWILKRRFFRQVQGLDEVELKKLAQYLISKKKVSLFPEKENLKSYDEEESKNWTSFQDWCQQKNIRRCLR